MNYRTFSVSSLSDNELNNLLSNIEAEKKRRADERAMLRQAWINRHFHQFHNTYDCVCHTRENLTIVAVYDEMEGTRIGTAYPINGDVYDHKTGVAVAFAKAYGEDIPDYI